MSMHVPVSFLLPVGDTADKLCVRLAEHVDCLVEAPISSSCCYLDSFDWRLHQEGLLLVQQGTEVQLQEKPSGLVLDRASVAGELKWPTDLSVGGLRDRLGKLLEMRALMPVVCVDTKSTILRIRDAYGKTVVRIRVDLLDCHAPNTRGDCKLLPRATLLPLKGYGDEMHQLATILRERLELKVAPASQQDEALVAIGRRPGDYSSKLNIRLESGLTAGQAMRVIMRHLLGTLNANIEGTKEDIDSEFLHDLRVATRRTRSALTQIKKVLPPAVLEGYKARFAWVGQITGPTRDMDVFLLDFDKYRNSLPTEMRRALDPLHAFLEEHHHTEQQALRRRLNAPQFRKLIKEWRDYLETQPETGDEMVNASRPVHLVSQERIWKMYRLVLKEGRAINFDSPAEEMHELRKSCKKLRYLMEFFRGLYPESKIGDQIKVLKVLLDNLGNYQDFEVQAHKMMDFVDQMKKARKAPTQTVMAMGALVADLLRLQEQAHKDFAARFAIFDTPANRRLNRGMFKPVVDMDRGDRV